MDDFRDMLDGVCKIIYPEECTGLINEYSEYYLKNLIIHNTNAEYICGEMHFCPKVFHKLTVDEYAKVIHIFLIDILQ